MRDLALTDERRVPVFLVNGSPEERGIPLRKLVVGKPRIVLCSLQYTLRARDSFDWLIESGYTLFVQWLNPGHSDSSDYADRLGFGDYLLHEGATLSVRDGRTQSDGRVREIRDFVTGWTSGRRL